MQITPNIKYIGVNDKNIDLFEGQYKVPNGISYNSYLIIDEKTTIMDTVDERKSTEWLQKLEQELNGIIPEYLVISHLEPDHSANIQKVINKYPNIKLISNDITFRMLPQFFTIEDLESRKISVKENDEINLGKHTLKFIMAPMVHWPEVMCTYETTEKILFTADGFGKFGALDYQEDWTCEARRYYFNIVGKYGKQVQDLLKKIENLEIKTICPLHGPILKENLEYYINKYNIWSSYKPEDKGILIACSSIYGNTYKVCEKLKEKLEKAGANKVVLSDLARDDEAEIIEDAFRYSTLILASATYNMEAFPNMTTFLNELKGKNYQNRTISLIENGSWAPNAAKCMKNIVDTFKNIELIEPIITIKTTLNNNTEQQLDILVQKLIEKEKNL